jgi:hypothetical protein
MTTALASDVSSWLAEQLLPTIHQIEITDWRRLVPPATLQPVAFTPSGGLASPAVRHELWARFFPESVPYSVDINPQDRFRWIIGKGANTVYLSTDSPTIDLVWDVSWRILRLVATQKMRETFLTELKALRLCMPNGGQLPNIRLRSGESECWLAGNVAAFHDIVRQIVGLLVCHTARDLFRVVHHILATLQHMNTGQWYALETQSVGVRKLKISALITQLKTSPVYRRLKADATAEWLDSLPNMGDDDDGGAYSRALLFLPAYEWLRTLNHSAVVTTSSLYRKALNVTVAAWAAQNVAPKEPDAAVLLSE